MLGTSHKRGRANASGGARGSPHDIHFFLHCKDFHALTTMLAGDGIRGLGSIVIDASFLELDGR